MPPSPSTVPPPSPRAQTQPALHSHKLAASKGNIKQMKKFYRGTKTRDSCRCYWSHALVLSLWSEKLLLASFPGCHGQSESSLRTRLVKPSLTLRTNLPIHLHMTTAHTVQFITWVVSNSFFIASFVLPFSAPNYKSRTQKHTTNLHRQVASKWQSLYCH